MRAVLCQDRGACLRRLHVRGRKSRSLAGSLARRGSVRPARQAMASARCIFCSARFRRVLNALAARGVRPLVHRPLIQREPSMAKEELLQFEGLVVEILPDARYRVQLDNGHALVAYTAGRMKKNRIKTLAGDRVTVEVSPYDLEKGRLIFRHKDERVAPTNRSPQRNQFRR